MPQDDDLPRQARDKHRKSWGKRVAFFAQDNYYLNNAVYLLEERLQAVRLSALSLCLSRACLGKMIVFSSIKWETRVSFFFFFFLFSSHLSHENERNDEFHHQDRLGTKPTRG